MRVLPYFAGAAVAVAIGGAVAGGAIDTTPRQIFASTSPLTTGSNAAISQTRKPTTLTANHYAIEAGDETYEVGELRERGLYSQDRYAKTYYVDDFEDDAADFDFAAADARQREWEAQQRRAVAERRSATRTARTASTRPLDLARPANVGETASAPRSAQGIAYVSQPVVQDTSAMASR
ncbi:MAG: hypothetical protein GW855_13460 [Erythrobacter sp.]|nr:hypothetical protein [Erythrobacter sp.]NCQ64978.1 hypothetical protein [Alphaproteobacteria bacterium]